MFGGDPLCAHEWTDGSHWQASPVRGGDEGIGFHDAETTKAQRTVAHATCRLCSTWRGQLGLEPTPDLYVEHLVAIFREVRRVLHPTGVLAVNMGDSYSNTGGHSGQSNTSCRLGRSNVAAQHAVKGVIPPGLPAGNLLGMPWRLAFALQRDGWILRSAVTCIKVAPMPESMAGVRYERCRIKSAPTRRAVQPSHTEAQAGVNNGHGARDGVNFDSRADWQDCPGCEKCAPNDGLVLRWGSGRPTSSTEMLFLFAKSARYFWDAEAVRVPAADYTRKGGTAPSTAGGSTTNGIGSNSLHQMSDAGRNAWNYQRFEDPDAQVSRYLTVLAEELFARGVTGKDLGDAMRAASAAVVEADLSPQDVWTWRPSPFGGAHFATMPVSLPTWCIKAATPEAGCCSACGMPYARVVEREGGSYQQRRAAGFGGPCNFSPNGHNATHAPGTSHDLGSSSITLGHRPTCTCNAPSRPALVLDPFAGAGTTLLAADRLGRDSIGIELSETYARMSKERITQDAGLFADIETE